MDAPRSFSTQNFDAFWRRPSWRQGCDRCSSRKGWMHFNCRFDERTAPYNPHCFFAVRIKFEGSQQVNNTLPAGPCVWTKQIERESMLPEKPPPTARTRPFAG